MQDDVTSVLDHVNNSDECMQGHHLPFSTVITFLQACDEANVTRHASRIRPDPAPSHDPGQIRCHAPHRDNALISDSAKLHQSDPDLGATLNTTESRPDQGPTTTDAYKATFLSPRNLAEA